MSEELRTPIQQKQDSINMLMKDITELQAENKELNEAIKGIALENKRLREKAESNDPEQHLEQLLEAVRHEKGKSARLRKALEKIKRYTPPQILYPTKDGLREFPCPGCKEMIFIATKTLNENK